MHRSEMEARVPCAGCGAAIADDSRSFAFGENQLLCWGCALRRGGSFDAEEDQWSTDPRTDDLMAEES
ncbi:MAG: hypothetical protein Q8R92_20405 [Deltaproteobacteria bacterium]|nr:hypothetical protein [Deltaproteobacteria bacterium]